MARKEFHETVLDEILDERACSSRGRRNHRGVKRKMSNYPIRPTTKLPAMRRGIENHIKILK